MKPVDGRHLRDDQMIAVWLGAGSVAHTEAALLHLQECLQCAGRYEDVAHELAALRHEGQQEVDAVFTQERLDAQREQILARLEHAGQPARVLPFPSHGDRRLSIFTRNQVRRWTAVAAAAGLVFGVGVSQLFDLHPAPKSPTKVVYVPVPVPQQRPAGYERPDAQKPSAEEMLYRSFYQQQVGDLQDFDEATPHVTVALNRTVYK